ncbi:MAG: DUF1549 domain-containing protein [Verrucomicrobia bacterium]|nr:DUF1549 domain-containing protein [Verrucomicrobiota bacterium]
MRSRSPFFSAQPAVVLRRVPRVLLNLLAILCPLAAMVASRGAPAMPTSNSSRHWAIQPLSPTNPPRTAGVAGSETGNTVDAWIRTGLARQGLSPSPPADRRTLLRRLSYDLTGLPPTFEEIESFMADGRPAAYERQVNRLLASPRFGERWARHWLDVARYAETKDLVLLYGKDRLRPYAYTYRDYVIRAINEDLPFADFVTDQLAADQHAPPRHSWRLAAMGFLTLGRLFDNNPHDIYDDQIDTVTRGFLGLTVSCARCHDHKYDPITARDYYALYGIFSASEPPLDPPLLESPETLPDGPQFEKALAAKRLELQTHIDQQYAEITETARRRTADYLAQVATQHSGLTENAVFFLSLSPEDLRPGILSRWRRFVSQRSNPSNSVFGAWHALMKVPEEKLASELESRLKHPESSSWNNRIRAALISSKPSTRLALARLYGEAIGQAFKDSQASGTLADASAQDQAAARELASILTSQESPVWFPKGNTYLHMSRVPRDKYGGLVTGLDKFAAHATNRPPARAMILADVPEIPATRVFLRGNPAIPGESVPRRHLSWLGGNDASPFTRGSGRLDLAQSILSHDFPLAYRVFANRVWQHLLGSPLVPTPSDFGVRTPPPKHPELLDDLAHRLLQHGSLKNLVRTIVLSETYRQSSDDRPSARSIDPDNLYFWRAHKRRLDFESMRDSLLAASGRLDPGMGGRSTDVAQDALNRRRTLYGLVDRQDVPALFRAFDFASPDQSSAMRPQTIVPQQALFALNSKFVAEQAFSLEQRIGWNSTRERDRVTRLYRTVLLRSPAPSELNLALRFLETAKTLDREEEHLSPFQQLAQTLLISNEMMFLD